MKFFDNILVLTDMGQKDIYSPLYMPNIKSAIRRSKRTQTQTLVNRIRKSKYKSAVKQMSIYLDSGKMKEAISYLPKFHSQLMKIAKTGVVNKKTASRKISKVTNKINNLKK